VARSSRDSLGRMQCLHKKGHVIPVWMEVKTHGGDDVL
jgi:hypothetical protein